MATITHRRLRVVSLVIAGLLMSGCGKKSPDFSEFKAWLYECPLLAHAGDPVLARAGDIIVRESEYQSRVRKKIVFGGSLASYGRTDRRRILEQILYNKITIRMAQNQNIFLDPADRRALLEDAEYGYIIQRIPVTDQEMRSFYTSHAQDFNLPDVIVSRLLMKSPAQAQKAQRLLKGGRSLESVAKELSLPLRTDRLKREEAGRLDPEFAKALVSLKPGQSPRPAVKRDGLEMIEMKTAPPPPPPPSSEAIKEQIYRRAQGEKVAKLYHQYVSSVTTEIDKPLLDSLSLPDASPITK